MSAVTDGAGNHGRPASPGRLVHPARRGRRPCASCAPRSRKRSPRPAVLRRAARLRIRRERNVMKADAGGADAAAAAIAWTGAKAPPRARRGRPRMSMRRPPRHRDPWMSMRPSMCPAQPLRMWSDTASDMKPACRLRRSIYRTRRRCRTTICLLVERILQTFAKCHRANRFRQRFPPGRNRCKARCRHRNPPRACLFPRRCRPTPISCSWRRGSAPRHPRRTRLPNPPAQNVCDRRALKCRASRWSSSKRTRTNPLPHTD